MAERGPRVGVVLVGPQACQLTVDGVEVVRVRATYVVRHADPATEVPAVAAATFEGADADRFRRLAPSDLEGQTEALWAAAEIQGAGLPVATRGWDAVVVVGWVDERGLVPALRALQAPTVVVIGGAPVPRDPSVEDPRAPIVDAIHSVVADRIRCGRAIGAFTARRPQHVLWLAIEQAARGVATVVEGQVADWAMPVAGPLVDLGPPLGLPSLWCTSAAPATFTDLVSLPMGPTVGLARTALILAAWRSLQDLITGPPVDVHPDLAEGFPAVPTVDAARDRIAEVVSGALGEVSLEGDGALVDWIVGALEPVVEEVQRLLGIVDATDEARLAPLRLFSLCGIDQTVEELRTLVESGHVGDTRGAIQRILDGHGVDSDAPTGAVHLTAWREAFAGVSCDVMARGAPGRPQARQLIRERLDDLRGALVEVLIERLGPELQRAADPRGAPTRAGVRILLDRAQRVQAMAQRVLEGMRGDALQEAEVVVRQDALVAWSIGRARGVGTPWRNASAADLVDRVLGILDPLSATAAFDRDVMDLATAVPLGDGTDWAFDEEVARHEARLTELPSRASEPIDHDRVLLALLEPCRPEDLASDLVDWSRSLDTRGGPSVDADGPAIDLCLPVSVAAEVEAWLRSSGLRVRGAAGSERLVVLRRPVGDLGHPEGRRRRRGLDEHHLADLGLPRPAGDTQATLVDQVNARVVIWMGLVLGRLKVRGGAHDTVFTVQGLGLPEGLVLPHEVLHVLAEHPQLLGRSCAAIDEAVRRLAEDPRADVRLAQLWEIGTLGPSPEVLSAIGLGAPGRSPVQWAVQALLRRHAERAIVAWADRATAAHVARLVHPVDEHTLVTVDQFGGGA